MQHLLETNYKHMYKISVSGLLNVCTWTNSVWHQLLTFKAEHSLWLLSVGKIWSILGGIYLEQTKMLNPKYLLITHLPWWAPLISRRLSKLKNKMFNIKIKCNFFLKKKERKKLINPLDPVKLQQNDWVKQTFTKMLHSNKTSRAELYMMLLLL